MKKKIPEGEVVATDAGKLPDIGDIEAAEQGETSDVINLLVDALTNIAETTTDASARTAATDALALFYGR